MFPRTLPIQTSKAESAKMNPRLSLRRLVSQFVEEQRRPCWRKTTEREMLPEGGWEGKRGKERERRGGKKRGGSLIPRLSVGLFPPTESLGMRLSGILYLTC